MSTKPIRARMTPLELVFRHAPDALGEYMNHVREKQGTPQDKNMFWDWWTGWAREHDADHLDVEMRAICGFYMASLGIVKRLKGDPVWLNDDGRVVRLRQWGVTIHG